MVRKMLKAFIRVTADKTHFAIIVNQFISPYPVTIHLSTTSTGTQLLHFAMYVIIYCVPSLKQICPACLHLFS